MKIGFSSLVCPAWDLTTIVSNAAEWGYQGIELRGLQGELHLPLAPQLARDPDGVGAMLAEKKIELVALSSSVALSAKSRSEVTRQTAALEEYLDLASRLGCPFVRIHAGEVERRDTHRAALARIVEQLRRVAPAAARRGVTILVENGGDFASSNDMWFVMDAVNHPSVKCCWNQCVAKIVRERPTTSLPRLGSKIGMMHLCDAEFGDEGVLLEYKPLGEGGIEAARQIELLKGLAFRGYLVFEWPKLWVQSLPAPETVLPAAAEFIRTHLEQKQAILTAYKSDKNAPRFAKPATDSAA